MKRRNTFALLPLIVLAGCDSAPPGSSFSQEVLPLLNRHCVMCHMEGGAQGEFSLHPDPYASLVGATSSQSELLMVVPGDTQGSYLYHKLQGTQLDVGGEGASMPYDRALLEHEDIVLVGQWIAQGALDN